MRVQLLSDLHLEFHRDGGRSFLESLDPSGVDVLVLAGDVDVAAGGLLQSLTMICRLYRDSSVVYVAGNHEFYNSDPVTVGRVLGRVRDGYCNFTWLDDEVVELGGVRFLGTTLWFPRGDAGPDVKGMLNDFTLIEDFEPWVYAANARAVDFLTREVRRGDVVVTHHLPSPQCVSSRYVGSILNQFFVCDLTELVENRRPLLWLFGHTHDSVRFFMKPTGDTLLCCNPLGYSPDDLNPNFREKLTVDVGGKI